jgi:predicted NUDIX family phosphoesterase
MDQSIVPLVSYTRAKRDETTFGYLPQFVLSDLVPDMSGSAQFYTENEIRNKMMEMDAGFVGMRRSTIDQTEAVRQLILYMVVTKQIGSDTLFAVYQRSAGSEDKLKDNYSFGFGGHVDVKDIDVHATMDENGVVLEAFHDVLSSYTSTMRSGIRELSEEIQLLLPEHSPRAMDGQEMSNELLAHYKLSSIQAVAATGPLDSYFKELEGEALFTTDTYVLVRKDSEPSKGILVCKTPTPINVLYVDTFGKQPTTRNVNNVNAALLPCGFLSDYKPEQKGFVGNTHIAVIGVIQVPAEYDFVVRESKYRTVGWFNRQELEADTELFEAWSKILIPHLPKLEEEASFSPDVIDA